MSFEEMSEDQLLEHLYQESIRRGYEFRIRLVRDSWRAALYMSYDPLGIGTERIRFSADGPDRIAALRGLAYVLEEAPE